MISKARRAAILLEAREQLRRFSPNALIPNDAFIFPSCGGCGYYLLAKTPFKEWIGHRTVPVYVSEEEVASADVGS